MDRKSSEISEFINLLNQQLLRLTGFFTLVTLYFVAVNNDSEVILSSLLKCAPIVALGTFVYLKGFKLNEDFRYSHMIMAGLIFSCFGDLFLNINMFPHGMAAFAIAQMFYIAAFEFNPWKIAIGIPLYLAAGGMTIYVHSTLDDVIKIGLPIYAVLLTTMCWRSIVRATERRDILSVLCTVGSVLFVASDSMICVSMFITPFRNSQIFIMITYYAAQFLISLSTLCDVNKPKKVKGSKKLSRKFRAQD